MMLATDCTHQILLSSACLQKKLLHRTLPTADASTSDDGWHFVTSQNDPNRSGFVPREYLVRAETLNQPPAPTSDSTYTSPNAYSPLPNTRVPQPEPQAPSSIYAARQAPLPSALPQRQEISPTKMTKIGPIRRLSDPRLEQHLLETLDPQAVQGTLNNSRNGAEKAQSIADVSQGINVNELTVPEAAMNEDYSSIVDANEKWLNEMQARHAKAFDGLLGSIESLSQKVSDCEDKNEEIVSQIQQLDALIEEERSKWKLRLDAEKSAMQERVASLYDSNKQ